MGDGGTLLVRDAVIPPVGAPSFARRLDLTILFMLGGMERSEGEQGSLLKGAGFPLEGVVSLGQPFDSIVAVPD